MSGEHEVDPKKVETTEEMAQRLEKEVEEEKTKKPDGAKIAQDKIQGEASPDDDAPTEKKNGVSKFLSAEELKHKRIYYARMLNAQCGGDRAKALKLLKARTGVDSWPQVTADKFPILDELLDDLANPNR